MRPENLSNQSFSSISHDRATELLAGDDTDPALGTGGGNGDDGEITTMGSATGVEDTLEVHAAANAPRGWQSIGWHLPRRGHGQALPPLGAPARENLTALLRRHTDEEPVGPLPVAAIRLKCAYALGHDSLNPL